MRTIDAMLRDVALGTTGILHFDHAPEPYANIDETQFPRIWVYDTRPMDTVAMNHSVTTSYRVLLEISKLVPLDGNLSDFETALSDIDILWYRFINRLSRDPRNKNPIGKVERIEILHKFDHNVAGYLCSFTVDVIQTPDYQCP